MTTGTWQNADGLLVKFEEYQRETPFAVNRLKAVNSYGPIRQLEMDINLKLVGASATYFPFDLTNDGTTRDGFTDEETYIPQGASIIRALFVTTEVAVGGTDFIVGTYTKVGGTTDADGIISATEGVIANMGTIGEIIIGNGDLVADTTGTVGITANSYVAVTTNGTFTAGKGKLLIEYMI